MIIGGGTIGLAIAWRAAAAGMSVTVVDENPGKGASWVAAGMLAPVTEVHYGEEASLALHLESARAFEGFAAELSDAAGTPSGYHACGTLVVARDADENAALEELFRFQIRLGLMAERLRSRECRALEPALAPSVRGGILVAGDHQVDSRAFLAALQRACERADVKFVAERATEVSHDDKRVTGVRLASGAELDCDAVVVAAGCWSASIDGIDPSWVPVRPVKGQLLHVRSRDGAPLVSHNIRGVDAYIVQRPDGRAVIGATVEERGFDTSVTAGASYELLRDAIELLPDVAEMEVVETIAGLRPGTPDNAPLLGTVPLEGLIVATGHYRNGMLLTPVTANSIATLLTTGETPEIIEPFNPMRFAREVATWT